MELLTPKEAQKLYPLMQVDDLVGAAFIPEDGHVDPYSLTQAYAKGIRKYGGRVIEGVMVTDLVRQNNRISHVVTDHGTIEADIVVNAAGLWARQVGNMAGIELPAGIVQHQYFVTEKTSDIPDDLPAFRDPDGGYYAKPEPGALAIGGWERTTDMVNPKEGFPWGNSRHLFDTNMDRMEEVFLPAAHRLPLLNHLGVRTVVNGPIPISPDGEPVMGPGARPAKLLCRRCLHPREMRPSGGGSVKGCRPKLGFFKPGDPPELGIWGGRFEINPPPFGSPVSKPRGQKKFPLPHKTPGLFPKKF